MSPQMMTSTPKFPTLDMIENGTKRGRKLRSEAFVAMLKTVFASGQDEAAKRDPAIFPGRAANA